MTLQSAALLLHMGLPTCPLVSPPASQPASPTEPVSHSQHGTAWLGTPQLCCPKDQDALHAQFYQALPPCLPACCVCRVPSAQLSFPHDPFFSHAHSLRSLFVYHSLTLPSSLFPLPSSLFPLLPPLNRIETTTLSPLRLGPSFFLFLFHPNKSRAFSTFALALLLPLRIFLSLPSPSPPVSPPER